MTLDLVFSDERNKMKEILKIVKISELLYKTQILCNLYNKFNNWYKNSLRPSIKVFLMKKNNLRKSEFLSVPLMVNRKK